jgi:hypothetical protein
VNFSIFRDLGSNRAIARLKCDKSTKRSSSLLQLRSFGKRGRCRMFLRYDHFPMAACINYR